MDPFTDCAADMTQQLTNLAKTFFAFNVHFITYFVILSNAVTDGVS